MAIALTAAVIQTAVVRSRLASGRRAFVGHVGGDDFVIISGRADVEDLCRAVAREFDARVGEVYEPSDRERGCIRLRDRAGAEREYPMLSLSMGVARSGDRRYSDALEAAEVATEMKNHAKRRSGSAYEIDRRSSDT